jgi:hypothetical protein
MALALLMTTGMLPAAAAPSTAPCAYSAAFVADVTVPDNSVQAPGVAFTKVWRLRNTGTCAWGPGTEVDSLAFAGGSQLGAPSVVPIAAVIRPNRTGDVAVTLTSPADAGTYTSRWKLRRTNGATFGLGSSGSTPFHARFVVSGGGTQPPPGAERIQFKPGATVGSVQSAVAFPAAKSYLVRASAGQRMTVAIVSRNDAANFSIVGLADGVPYKRVIFEDRMFSFVLERTQDYLVTVQVPSGRADFVLSLSIY